MTTTGVDEFTARIGQRTLCDDSDSVRKALEALQSSRYLACDLEGNSLGERDGKLSIITLCAIPVGDTLEDAHTYLFDAAVLGDEQLRPVFDILRSTEHAKVMFDCRMDYSELHHRHGVELAHVLDLQLADIESRSLRGEGMDKQLARLSPFCHSHEVRSQPAPYHRVHRLNGLEGCAKEHDVISRDACAKPSYFPHYKWKDRPLDSSMIDYAVTDVCLIARLYTRFLSKGYINEGRLIEQSGRYLALCRQRLPKQEFQHPLLPLEILSAPTYTAGTLVCKTCSRLLSPECFSKSAQRLPAQRNCWICRAVHVRASRIARLEREYEYDFDSE